MRGKSIIKNIISIVIWFSIRMLWNIISVWNTESIILTHYTFRWFFTCERALFKLFSIHLLDNQSIIFFHTFTRLYHWVSIILCMSLHRTLINILRVKRLSHLTPNVFFLKLTVVQHWALPSFKLIVCNGLHWSLIVLPKTSRFFIWCFSYIHFFYFQFGWILSLFVCYQHSLALHMWQTFVLYFHFTHSYKAFNTWIISEFL